MEKHENNSINHIVNETNKLLYRYDLELPPNEWSTDLKNFEYNFTNHGVKNKAGLFFFTDSIDIANHLGINAAIKESRTEYYLTTVKIEGAPNIIDFSSSINIFQMLCILEDLKIRKLLNEFETFINDFTFSNLNHFFDKIEFETDLTKKSNIIINNLRLSENSREALDVSVFGQRLTDFDNGIKFRQIINESYSQIDGYKWREFEDNRGLTYCLFNSDKLSDKNTDKIIL